MMRKFISALVMLGLIQFVHGQIEIFPVFINPCDSSIVPNDDIQLYSDTNLYMSTGKTFRIHEFGAFSLSRVGHNYSSDIYISSPNDTILLPRVSVMFLISSPPVSVFYECDVAINGKVVDYYADGTKMFEGTFFDGYGIDTVRYYYPNGKVEQEHYFKSNQHRYAYSTFYESGKLESYNFLDDYTSKEYYESGQLKRNVKYARGSFEYSYYEDGSKKLVRDGFDFKLYNEAGQLEEKHKANKVPFSKLFGTLYTRSKWKYYDEGKLVRKIKYSNYGFGERVDDPWDLDPISIDKIIVNYPDSAKKKIIPEYTGGPYSELIFVVYYKLNGKWVEHDRLQKEDFLAY